MAIFSASPIGGISMAYFVCFAGTGKTASSSAATDVCTADSCSATESSSPNVQVLYNIQSCRPVKCTA